MASLTLAGKIAQAHLSNVKESFYLIKYQTDLSEESHAYLEFVLRSLSASNLYKHVLVITLKKKTLSLFAPLSESKSIAVDQFNLYHSTLASPESSSVAAV